MRWQLNLMKRSSAWAQPPTEFLSLNNLVSTADNLSSQSGATAAEYYYRRLPNQNMALKSVPKKVYGGWQVLAMVRWTTKTKTVPRRVLALPWSKMSSSEVIDDYEAAAAMGKNMYRMGAQAWRRIRSSSLARRTMG